MTCCNNPIDLGCKSACAPITTTIPTAQTGFSVVYNFNGTWVSTPAEVVDGYVTVPAGTFNESSNVTFQIFNNVNAFVACFKASIHPGDVDFEMNKPVLIPIDTEMSIDGANPGCSNGLNIDEVSIIILTGFSGIQYGTIYNVDVEVTHGGNPHTYQLYRDKLLTMPVTDNKIIQIEAPGQTPVFYVATQFSNCNQKYTLTVNVISIENYVTGYKNGIHLPNTWSNL